MAKTIKLDWYGDEMQQLIERSSPDALYGAGNVVLDAAKTKIRDKTGNLRKSGYTGVKGRSNYQNRPWYRKEIRVQRSDRAVVAFSAPHAHLIEATGAQPSGVIRPTSRKALLIPGIGFRASARHAGMRPRPFLGPALEGTRDRMATELARRLRQDLEQKMGT